MKANESEGTPWVEVRVCALYKLVLAWWRGTQQTKNP